jgi:hypothetical protein
MGVLMSRFTYKDLQARYERMFEHYEFGIPTFSHSFWHKEQDKIVLSYDGNRIYEARSDGNCYLIIPKQVSSGVGTRWQYLFSRKFFFRKRKKADGTAYHSIHITPVENTPGAVNIDAQRMIKVTVDQHNNPTFEPADEITVTAVKDADKYKAYNKKLNILRKTVLTQIRLGIYNDMVSESHNSKSANRQVVMNILSPHRFDGQSPYIHEDEIRKLVDGCIEAWHKNDTSIGVLKPLVAISMYSAGYHISRRMTSEAVLANAVKNTLRNAQVRYLRGHCVTLSESKATLRTTNDQDSQLQPAAGFREVPVSGEAQVC